MFYDPCTLCYLSVLNGYRDRHLANDFVQPREMEKSATVVMFLIRVYSRLFADRWPNLAGARCREVVGDARRHRSSANAVVDIDHRQTRCAGLQHRQQCRFAVAAHAIPDRGR